MSATKFQQWQIFQKQEIMGKPRNSMAVLRRTVVIICGEVFCTGTGLLHAVDRFSLICKNLGKIGMVIPLSLGVKTQALRGEATCSRFHAHTGGWESLWALGSPMVLASFALGHFFLCPLLSLAFKAQPTSASIRALASSPS